MCMIHICRQESVMEPVLQRLGDVTIQRLEKPKDPKQDPPSGISHMESNKPEEDPENLDGFFPSDEESSGEFDDKDRVDYHPPVSNSLPSPQTQDFKRRFPEKWKRGGLNLGPEISFKKFKPADNDVEKEVLPSKVVPKLVQRPISPVLSPMKYEDDSEPNLSEDEVSYYDSELESEGELQDLGYDLGINLDSVEERKDAEVRPQATSLDSMSANTEASLLNSTLLTSAGRSGKSTISTSKSNSLDPVSKGEPTVNLPSSIDGDEGSIADGDESFFEKLVERADIPPSIDATCNVKLESPDEDYDIDIKEKLKEMGVTFASVKKGDKPKNPETPPSENEVVITKKSGEEVTVMSKGNLRRNIREVMDDTKLDETTLAAQRQEAERLKRVQEQQRILREYQRQVKEERMQQRVMSLLQGNDFPKPGPSNQTRIGNTVLVKLPNGQSKPMTKVPKPPFDVLKMPKIETAHSRYPHPGSSLGPMVPMGPMGAPRGYPRRPIPHRRSSGGVNLPASLSFSPLSHRGPPLMPTISHHSDSDSESEEIRRDTLMKLPKAKRGKSADSQTIEVSSDDDCIVVSESEADQNMEDEDQDDPSNSGMHTNDEFNLPDEQGRVLVNVGHTEDEPDVFVAPQIARIIKPHQIGGVRFLYDNIVESITRFDSSAGFGCILAHSMGLGKTLQIVTFSDVFLRYTPTRTILCIMPINTLQNWLAEYNMWTPTAEAAANSPLGVHGEVRPRNFNIHVLNDAHRTLVARQKVIHEWTTNGGVLLIGYEQYRLLSMKKNPKTKRKSMAAPEVNNDDKNKPIFDEIYTALVNPGPDLVICDEGHRIKNAHASTSTALKQLRTKRRVVLTGYPLQNNLTEYWCMVDFVRPNYLGSKTEFLNMFERPIMNGQCIDSTEADIKLMRYRAHVLHSLLVGFVQRRSHRVLQTVLPQKEEYVLLVRLTPFQRLLYDRFMNEVVRKQSVPNPLKAFAVCCKIWNHPDVLYNFLVKRARGDAVDLDLEEVASTISRSTTSETKPKRGPGKPRKAPLKGRGGKPAASITPYNSNMEPSFNPMQLPTSTGSNGPPINSQSANSPGHSQAGANNISFSTAPKSSETNYGPYTDEFNQPRITFEGISQFFDDHITQSTYSQNFDENAQFSPRIPRTFAQSPSAVNSCVGGFTQPIQNMSQNQNSSSNLQAPGQTRLFNLDSQNTVTVSSTNQAKQLPIIPSLPSGISLTPLSNKNQTSSQNFPSQVKPPLDSMEVTPPTNPTSFGQYVENVQLQPQISHFGSQNPAQKDFESSQNPQIGFAQSEQWKHEINPSSSNLNPTPSTSPLRPKKEELSPSETTNHFASPLKSESSNDSKPKINIISDIILPSVFASDKKKKNISDCKIDIKKEDVDEDKFGVKREIEKIKNELNNELKIEDDNKPLPVGEPPLSKFPALSPAKDSKEDSGIPYDWAIDLLKEYVPGKIDNSAKFLILFRIIRESLALGDRLLVFSQSLITLDLIEQFLQASDIPGETQKWAKNISYFRLDGSTVAQEREKLINEFNSNPKIYLFLVSTRAGSLGINLIGANRVVVLDASWNPCHDTQAVCRVYRYGQRKPCFVYRLVVDNCLEKKIYDRQVSKQGMSDRVVDECNPDAHLTIKDVSTLCFDDKKDEGEIKDWSFCKDKYIDVVLQKVLQAHGTSLTKEPFQHESLLVDRKEKQLSQQEKRLAKKGYEREKNAARQPSYLSGSSRGQRPVASVRPMQQGGERPSRWIPAEHWQRQGMTAQEMTLPLDVVIPTNQPEKGNIVLKAGQKVLVLKSPKGVYMQLESGKIVAIKTAIKVKGKADDNSSDPMKMSVKTPFLPPSMKVNPPPPMSPIAQKRPCKQTNQGPFMTGTRMNMKSVQKQVPNLSSRVQGVGKKLQNMQEKPKPYEIGAEIMKPLKENEPLPGSSSEDEHPPLERENARPQLPLPTNDADTDDLEKRIFQLKKNISIQRVTTGGVKQPIKALPTSQIPGSSQPLQPSQQQKSTLKESQFLPKNVKKLNLQEKSKIKQGDSILERLGQSTSIMETTPFQETLDSITAGFKNPDHLDHLDTDDDEDEGRPSLDDLENEEDGISDESLGPHKQVGIGVEAEPIEGSDQSDEVTYVSEQPGEAVAGQFPNQPKSDGSADYNASNYSFNYNYNVTPYQGHPPPQSYTYPPQQAPSYDSYSGYTPQQPPYNYGFQGYPPQQPHYASHPPQPGYDYNNPPPVYPNYPYPTHSQQYAPPPQGMYPPPAAGVQPTGYTEYSQYPGPSQPTSNYYQNN
ncbi:helicase ARIP4 [Euwallacea fornicatus]|uniref:helicase ARIP4 n=1 Tax=Euwallacea fornicatus TaxID=995702 RepID=UPI00338F484F